MRSNSKKKKRKKEKEHCYLPHFLHLFVSSLILQKIIKPMVAKQVQPRRPLSPSSSRSMDARPDRTHSRQRPSHHRLSEKRSSFMPRTEEEREIPLDDSRISLAFNTSYTSPIPTRISLRSSDQKRLSVPVGSIAKTPKLSIAERFMVPSNDPSTYTKTYPSSHITPPSQSTKHTDESKDVFYPSVPITALLSRHSHDTDTYMTCLSGTTSYRDSVVSSPDPRRLTIANAFMSLRKTDSESRNKRPGIPLLHEISQVSSVERDTSTPSK
ncbi:hypothetical protein BDF14DRAFT_1312716 [Spinellus fusiger]|nr:hypothetical protein BDF14DRAFT_1312716 [Spinellus fusiger]